MGLCYTAANYGVARAYLPTLTTHVCVCFHWEQNQLAKVANVFGNSYRRGSTGEY